MDIGANNPDSFYETPSIDRLAADGIRLTQAYAAAPVCSPTRASIMTGKYPGRLHTTDYFGAPQPSTVGPNYLKNKVLYPAEYIDQLPASETTMAEAFGEAGYGTFFAGKWHLGNEGSYPEDHGFDVNKGGGMKEGDPMEETSISHHLVILAWMTVQMENIYPFDLALRRPHLSRRV